MANENKTRNSRGVPQALSLSLLVVGVGGAGLVAFLTRGTNSVPSGRMARNADEPRADEAVPVVLPPRVRKSDPSVEERPNPVKLAPEALQQVADMKVPTLQEALDRRRTKVEPRRDIVEHGVLALLPKPTCEAPAELVDVGRSGEGVYGCVIETPGRQPHVVGRAVFRKGSGNLEVGDHENGQRTGEWHEYYPTGVLASVGSFVNDQRDGEWHEYDEAGEHRFSRSYGAGRKHGVVIRYLGDTTQIDLYFEGGKYDPESREPILQTFVAEAP